MRKTNLTTKAISFLMLAGLLATTTEIACQDSPVGADERIEQLKKEMVADPDFNLNSALLDAAGKKQPSVVRWLLKQGASPNASDFISGDSVLHIAVANGDLGTVLELVQRGARVEVKNAAGKSPFESANEPIKNILIYYRDNPVPISKPEGRDVMEPDKKGERSDSTKGTSDSNSPGSGKTLTNSIGIQLQRVSAGTFSMGSHDSPAKLGRVYGVDPRYFESEVPTRKVEISRPFYLAIHEVTVGQFAEFVQESKYQTDAERFPDLGETIDRDHTKLVRQPGGTWRKTGFEQKANHPVVNVSWFDAQRFCKWLSEKEGRTYRLPTEAEWEYACRAGTTTRYSTGDQPSSLKSFANVMDRTYKDKYTQTRNNVSFRDKYVYTAPVGSFRPNEFGIYDMHGNVWEWCSDWYSPDYYRTGPDRDPAGPSRGERRSLRGGCWF